MNRAILFIAILSFLAASCLKDRIAPPVGPYVPPNGDTLMYYWNFNGADSSKRNADFGVHSGAFFKYYCAYIDYTGGSVLNLVGSTDSGQCLRLRNPSDSVIFHMPTTGYDSVSIAFAIQASSSGANSNAIYYTTDGVHFVSTALSSNTYSVTTLFTLKTFSFSEDAAVNNNPLFAVKIVPLNNNTGTSGNNRIDNLTLHGVRK
jgi:hypothetical protein